jgi:hypothetical protein
MVTLAKFDCKIATAAPFAPADEFRQRCGQRGGRLAKARRAAFNWSGAAIGLKRCGLTAPKLLPRARPRDEDKIRTPSPERPHRVKPHVNAKHMRYKFDALCAALG